MTPEKSQPKRQPGALALAISPPDSGPRKHDFSCPFQSSFDF